MEACLHGQEKAIYGDKTYADERRRQRAEEEGVQWRVHRKANRGRRLNCADRSYNRKNDRARARIAHASNVPKASSKPLGLSQSQVPGSYQEHGPSLHPVRPGQLPSGPKGTGSHIGRRSSNTGGQGQTGRSETHPGPKTPSQVRQTTLFSTWSPSKQTRIIPLDRTTGLIRGSYDGFAHVWQFLDLRALKVISSKQIRIIPLDRTTGLIRGSYS